MPHADLQRSGYDEDDLLPPEDLLRNPPVIETADFQGMGLRQKKGPRQVADITLRRYGTPFHDEESASFFMHEVGSHGILNLIKSWQESAVFAPHPTALWFL